MVVIINVIVTAIAHIVVIIVIIVITNTVLVKRRVADWTERRVLIELVELAERIHLVSINVIAYIIIYTADIETSVVAAVVVYYVLVLEKVVLVVVDISRAVGVIWL